MTNEHESCSCRGAGHWNRRTLLQAAGVVGASWLTPLSRMLAQEAERAPRGKPAKSVIVLWLGGGPSQLETFDPHPGTRIGGDTEAIATTAPGVKIGAGFPAVAEVMDQIALVRSVTSKEGDHERATYNAKTGYRPDPTLVHPAIGAVVCHQLQDEVEIPRHVSILAGQWSARGGYLGDQFDAFRIGDPKFPIPDVQSRADDKRARRRVDDLFQVVETEFARGRLTKLDARKTLHDASTRAAIKMMSSEQLQAFEVSRASDAERELYGDTPFGRGCLAARRLIEVGVRCVEIALDGWDTHANNHALQMARVAQLDPALAALIRDLKDRELLESTVVVCGGEFGRTPRINPAQGRDHWPHGFSMALAGGGIRGGRVYGATSPQPSLDQPAPERDVENPRDIADVHATILHVLGIDFSKELQTPIGRPMAISKGTPIQEIL